jgi:hypothetical protein
MLRKRQGHLHKPTGGFAVRKRAFVVLSIAVLFVCAADRGNAQTGTIRGRVEGDDGLPLSGATVLYNNVREYTRDSMGHRIATGVAINSGARTARNGSFTISGLPAGSYYLCAFGTQANHLSSCEWGQGSLLVQLSAAQVFTDAVLRVSEGSLLVLRVSDPNGRIQDTAASPPLNGRLPLAGGNFKVGIMAGGRYARANFVSQQGVVRSYVVAVPKTAFLQLFLNTTLRASLPTGESVEVDRPAVPISVTGQAQLFVDLEVQ